jgi:hypothetical protein
MKTFLFKWLVLPLCTAASVSMLVSLCVPDPWRSLLVNMAATFLGSVVTVFFVEAILRRGEEQRWKKFRGHVSKQVSILANGTASSIRNALAIPPPGFRNDVGGAPGPRELRLAMLSMIEEDLVPATGRLMLMDQDDWRIFANNLIGTMRSCELLLTLFGPKLDVEIAVLILDMYERARAVLAPYEILPDLLGVPFEKLRPNRRGESSLPIVQAMVNGAIRDVEQLLRICAALLRELGSRFPESSKNED